MPLLRRLAPAIALTLGFTVVPGSAALAVSRAGCPAGVAAAMRKVNDHWIAGHPRPAGRGWTTGTYVSGDLAAARALGDRRYLDHAARWAAGEKYALADPATTNADDQTVGQDYIGLYLADPRHPASDIAAITRDIAAMVRNPRDDYWTWIDALHMAMPVFAGLGVILHDPAYLAKMHALYEHTKTAEGGGLWDARTGLWWRDKSFAGTNVHWSRGNGWVLAALAKVLGVLPATDPHRAEYVRDLRRMVSALRRTQRPDGFWNVDLTDPADFPGPETSGTAFFAYGIAWGVAHHLLPATVYRPVVTRAWHALVTTAIRPDGTLGYVQGPAAGPADHQPVTARSTADYGVGAFLLAGAQMCVL